MKRRTLCVFLLVSGFTLAQSPSPDVIRIDVNLVQVDAVVTDSRNRHVSDLKADDFIVLQDGKPQTISNFSYITGGSPLVPGKPPARQPGIAMPPPPAVPLKAGEVRRVFALVVDDLGLSFESIVHVRDGLRKFVDHQMQPGDMVAIIRTSGGLGVLQQFTTDKGILHAAIDHVKFTMGRVGVDSFEPVGQITDPPGMPERKLSAADANAAIDQVRSQMFTVGTLGAIRYVIDGLRDMPGRKSVMLFSENMELFNMVGDLPVSSQGGFAVTASSARVIEDMDHLIDAANRSSAVVYTIDPRGLQVLFPGAADRLDRLTGGGTAGKVMLEREAQMFNSQQGLSMLAEKTGGLFIRNDNFVDDAINQAIADSEGYYLIGYHPDADTFDPTTGRRKFHNIQVKVNTAGLHVRSRSGFFGESDEDARAVPRSSHEELLHALTSPFSSGDVHMRLTALFEQASNGLPFLNAMLHIDARDLKFTPQPGGTRRAAVEVAAMTFGESGQPLDQSDRHFEITVDDGQYAAVESSGLVFRVNQPLQRAGLYQVRVALRDEDSGQLGSASQFMATPDLTKGHLALSSIFLAESTIQADKWGVPDAEGQVAGNDPISSAAERVFKSGAALSYQYTIFNAQSDALGNTDLRVQTRIFRDGRPVYQGQPMIPDLGGQTNKKRLRAGGNMVLARGVPAGNYVLQVIVVDKLARQKYQTSSQWMDFEVRQ